MCRKCCRIRNWLPISSQLARFEGFWIASLCSRAEKEEEYESDFRGICGIKGYRLYDPVKRDIRISCDIVVVQESEPQNLVELGEHQQQIQFIELYSIDNSNARHPILETAKTKSTKRHHPTAIQAILSFWTQTTTLRSHRNLICQLVSSKGLGATTGGAEFQASIPNSLRKVNFLGKLFPTAFIDLFKHVV